MNRLTPNRTDLATLLVGFLAPYAAGMSPDPTASLDVAHLAGPALIAAGTAFGGLVAKTFGVFLWSYLRAKARAMLSDNNPANDAEATAILTAVDRVDPEGATSASPTTEKKGQNP